jgi:hypothetical protein
MDGQQSKAVSERTAIERPHPGPAPQPPDELEDLLGSLGCRPPEDAQPLQATANKAPTKTIETIEISKATRPPRLEAQQKDLARNKGKATIWSIVWKLNNKDVATEPASAISRPPPLKANLDRSDGHNPVNGDLRDKSHCEPSTKPLPLLLPTSSNIDVFQHWDTLQSSTQQPPFPEQKKLHLSTAQRIVSRLLPFIQLEKDLWVRFDLPIDPGLKARWPSKLRGFNHTFLKEGLKVNYYADLVMASSTGADDNMQPTVMFVCERKDLHVIKKIATDSPFIEDGCKLRFVNATSQRYYAGSGLSVASSDGLSLFVEACLSNTGHLCGARARAFTKANLYTKEFTIGGLILINDCCYALTSGHSLMGAGLAKTLSPDGTFFVSPCIRRHAAKTISQRLNSKSLVRFTLVSFLHYIAMKSYWTRLLIGHLLRYPDTFGERTG